MGRIDRRPMTIQGFHLARRPALLGALALAFLLAWAGVARGFAATQEGSSEQRVKAAFLFKFLGYVRWPKEAFEDEKAPVLVAVFGPDPFGSVLDETFKAKKVGERAIEVRRYRTLEALGPCHVLFLSPAESARLAAVQKRLGSRPALLVADGEGLAAQGATIAFYPSEKRIRFEINPEAAKRAGLEVSSELLKLARIVTDKGTGGL